LLSAEIPQLLVSTGVSNTTATVGSIAFQLPPGQSSLGSLTGLVLVSSPGLVSTQVSVASVPAVLVVASDGSDLVVRLSYPDPVEAVDLVSPFVRGLGLTLAAGLVVLWGLRPFLRTIRTVATE